MEGINYGKNNKRIIFTDTDHRHAQLILKLKTDGLTQAKFFRSLIAGYVNGDPRIEEFILEQGNLSAAKKDKVHRNLQEGRDIVTNLGLSEDQIEDLFDVIAGEHPDL